MAEDMIGTSGFIKDAAGRMRDAGTRAGEAMREGGQRIAANNQQIGVKMIDQAEQNAAEAFAAMRKAAQATDLSGVMQAQGDYLREQSQRSMAQAREIGELIVQFGREAITTMRGGTGGSEPRTGGE